MKDITGKKYNKLTVIDKAFIKNHRWYWNCQCDCGNIRQTFFNYLETGQAAMCFDCSDSQSSKNSAIYYIFTRVKRQALERCISWNLTKKDVEDIIFKNCYYCENSPSNFIRHKQRRDELVFKYNGIDRIDSNSGYALDNIVPCCIKCNRAKSDMSMTEFKDWIKTVFNKFVQK